MSWPIVRRPAVGDWIKTTEKVPITFTDAVVDGGLPAGTRGVVTEVDGVFGGHVVARVDRGIFGSATVRLRARQVRVVRRAGGVENYEKHVGRRLQIRLGAALALLGPVVYFCLSYVAHGGRRDGMVLALVEGALYGALDTVTYVINDPVRGLAYCVVVWTVSRIALGRW